MSPLRPLTSTRAFPILAGVPGPTELIIILVIVMVIFGASRLPQIGKGLGEGIRNFRSGVKETPEIDVTPPAEDDSGNSGSSTTSGS